MKLNFRLYEEAGAGGSGGGGGGNPPAGAPSGSPSLLAPASGGGNDPPPAGNQPSAANPPVNQPAGGDQWHVGLYDATGKINAAKFDALPEHLKGHKELFARYQTVEALMGGLANMSSLAGKKALAPLPANASPEAKAEQRKLIGQLNGAPEKPEGYGFKKPDGVPDEQWNGKYMEGVQAILHKHGIGMEAAKELFEFDKAQAGEITTGSKAAQEKAQTEYAAAQSKALDTAFGADKAKNVDLAVRAIKTAGLDPLDPMFRNAQAVILAAKFGAMISEDKLISGETNANAGMDDRAKALDIVNNPSNSLYKAFHEPDHPQHEQAVQARSQLNKAYHQKSQPKN